MGSLVDVVCVCNATFYEALVIIYTTLPPPRSQPIIFTAPPIKRYPDRGVQFWTFGAINICILCHVRLLEWIWFLFAKVKNVNKIRSSLNFCIKTVENVCKSAMALAFFLWHLFVPFIAVLFCELPSWRWLLPWRCHGPADFFWLNGPKKSS